MKKKEKDTGAPVNESLARVIDDLVKNNFRNDYYHTKNFWAIDELRRPEVLQAIAEHPLKWLPLNKIARYLTMSSRFAFWRFVFQNRGRLPQNALLEVWYDCLDDLWSMGSSLLMVTTEQGEEIYHSNVSNPRMQKASPVTDSLLLDNPIVCYRYCQVEKKGWKYLRYIQGRRHQRLKMSKATRDAIHEDNHAAFAMHVDMCCRKSSFSLLNEVIEKGAANVFRYMLEHQMVPESMIQLPELCCYLVACFPDHISVPFLTVLEENHPGLVKSVKDSFGRNLLWFAVQNKRTGWFHPDCKLTAFLIEHGCDPQNVNQLGLSWQAVFDGLPFSRQRKMMQRRYNMDQHLSFLQHNIPSLYQSQPLERLVGKNKK